MEPIKFTPESFEEASSSQPVITSNVEIVAATVKLSSKGDRMIVLELSHADWGDKTKKAWSMVEGGGATGDTGVKYLYSCVSPKPMTVGEVDSTVKELLGVKIKIKEELRKVEDKTDPTFNSEMMGITAIRPNK